MNFSISDFVLIPFTQPNRSTNSKGETLQLNQEEIIAKKSAKVLSREKSEKR